MKPKVLIVDDDEEIRVQMKWALSQQYEVLLAEDRAGAVSVFKSELPVVTLLDLGLPPHPNECEEGLAALSDLLGIDDTAKIIMISGQGEKKNALQAVGAGAYDFLCKPIDMEELKFLLGRCTYVSGLEKEYRQLQRSVRAEGFEDMLAASPQMQGVFAYIRKVAKTTAPVLLLGESGTGKEMAALAIHRRSLRNDGSFIAINCNAIPENLLESELFGHEKGAFTGAHVQRKGMIESASEGTLFLDEIGELPAGAATNVDLKQAVAEGKFREDLYFRLAVVVIKLPPLRERADDVALLAREFLHKYAAQNGKTNLTFSPEALRAINCYAWPGNVRELQNRVKRAVIMADGKRITEKDLELSSSSQLAGAATLKEARESVERELIQQTLKRHLGKVTSAAAELGISRPTLYELMEKLGIAKQQTRDGLN